MLVVLCLDEPDSRGTSAQASDAKAKIDSWVGVAKPSAALVSSK